MIQIQKTLKRIGLTFVFIFASILLIIQIPILNTSLTQSLLNFFLPPNHHVSISKIQGSFPFDIKIQTINLFDGEGKWGALEDLEYSWRGINLLFGNVHFDRVSLKSANFTRLPSFFKENPSSEVPNTFIEALPKKIPHVNIDRFHIEELMPPPCLLLCDKKFSILGELSSDYSNNHSIACFISHIDHGGETRDFITLVSKIEKDKVVITAHVDDQVRHFLKYFKKEDLLQSHGDISAKIKIITERSFSNLYMSARASLNNLVVSDLNILPFLEKELSFRLKIIKEGPESKIKISQLTVRTDRGSCVTGGLLYDWNTTNFTGNLNLTLPLMHNYFNNGNKILKGNTSIQSEISGSIKDKKTNFTLMMQGLSFNNSFDAFTGSLDFQWLVSDHPFGFLTLETKQPEGITTLKTAVWADQFPVLAFRDIKITGPQTDVKGLFNFNTHTLFYDGQLSGSISDLSVYSEWIGQPIKGKLHFNINKIEEKCNLSVVVSDLWLKKIAADHINIEAQLKQLEPEYLGVKAKNFFFNFASLGFDTLDFDLSTQKKSKIFSFQGYKDGKKMVLTGEVENRKEDIKTFILKTLTINDEKETLLSLEKPSFLEIDSLQSRLTDFHLRSKNGAIFISNFQFSSALSGLVKIQAFPLDLFFIFNDNKPFIGAIDGEMKIDGPLENPTLDVWLKGALRDTSTKFGKKGLAVKVLSYDFKAHQEKNVLTFETSLSSAKQLSFKGGGNLKTKGFLKGDDPLTAQFSLHGNLSAFNSFVLVNDRFGGQIEGAFDLKGVLQSPILTGKLSINNGVFEDSELGTVLQKVTAQANIKDSVLTFSTCTCHDFSKGRAVCLGFIDFKKITSPLIGLDVNFNDYVVVNKDDFTAKANGKLILKTQDKGYILISGDIDILKGEYIVQDTPETHRIIKVHEDPDLRKNSLGKEYVSDYHKGFLILNINVHFQDYFYIYGFGLKSQWNGDMTITGNADRTRLNGQLNLLNGTLMIANKSMTLSQGAISFDGGKDKDPTILMVANREISGFKTFFRIEGKASNSTISIGAIPSLSQNQALSLILFGKPLNNITPAQSIQLALTMGNLKNSHGHSLTDTLGQSLGFDTLSLEQDETISSDPDLNPGYKVRLGKQLNDYIYLGLSQGFSKDTGTNGILEADITKNTKVQLSAGTGERSNSVSYMWEKKY